MVENNRIIFFILNIVLWVCGIFTYFQITPEITAIILFVLASINMIYFCYTQKSFININNILNLSYLLTIALSCLHLIGIESDTWSISMWICLSLFYFSFYIFSFVGMIGKENLSYRLSQIQFKVRIRNCSFLFCLIFSLLSLISFAFLAWQSGYIPLLSLDPQAYVNFGNGSSLALFYQISVIIPGICIYELKDSEPPKKILYIFMILINFGICLLLKSRDYLTACFVISFIVYWKRNFSNSSNLNIYKFSAIFVIALFIIVLLWVSSRRNYSDSYINGLYQAENSPLPQNLISIYAYITTPYYNLNLIINNLQVRTYGLKELNPIWILFHIYPLRNYLAGLPVYLIHPALNVCTSLADSFYDFGYLGMILLGFIYGYLFSLFEIIIKKYNNPFASVLYGICLHHLIFIFFTGWIGNFQYFIYTILLVLGYLLMDKEDYYLLDDKAVE